MDKKAVLKSYWGFDAFRPLQEDIIDSVLAKKDTLALLPTGGGKSLCYQLPALMNPGFTLVVSPLIALMEDQVSALKELGVKAMYFESDPKGLSLSKQLDNALYGNYKVVFVSPERLGNPSFLQQIKSAPISLIAIDEAHCISEWGHDFRPSYRKINVLREIFPQVPLLALTASATVEVKKDIEVLLKLKSPSSFTASFERVNLAYKVWNTEDKFTSVLQLVKYHKGSSIIYCYTRKQTELLAEFLNQNQHKASYFHAGLLSSQKKARLKAWQEGVITHMVATTAFGMGIDKADVRTVIHTSIADSIENYYQESGRAGRDGKAANSFLLYHKGDLLELENKILGQIPLEEELKQVYKDLCNFFQIAYGEGQDQTHSLDVGEFCKRYQHTEKKLHQCLIQLEKTGVLNWYASKTKELRVKSKSSPERAQSFTESGTTSAKVMEYLMRQYPHFFIEAVRVKQQAICAALRLSKDRLDSALYQLQQENLIEYTDTATNLYIAFQVPREDQYTLRPAKDLLKKLKNQKVVKLNAIISFVKEEKKCRRNMILDDFGETKVSNCQQCSSASCKTDWDACADFESKVIELLKKQPHSIQELKQKLYFEPKALEALFAVLMERQQIIKNPQHKFYWIDE